MKGKHLLQDRKRPKLNRCRVPLAVAGMDFGLNPYRLQFAFNPERVLALRNRAIWRPGKLTPRWA
jgi:hypothetical protein